MDTFRSSKARYSDRYRDSALTILFLTKEKHELHCPIHPDVHMNDHKWVPTNRDRAKATKRGLFWCRCDRNYVAKTGKCELCGWRANRKKIKNGLMAEWPIAHDC